MSKSRLTVPNTGSTSDESDPGARCSRYEALPMRFSVSLSLRMCCVVLTRSV